MHGQLLAVTMAATNARGILPVLGGVGGLAALITVGWQFLRGGGDSDDKDPMRDYSLNLPPKPPAWMEDGATEPAAQVAEAEDAEQQAILGG